MNRFQCPWFCKAEGKSPFVKEVKSTYHQAIVNIFSDRKVSSTSTSLYKQICLHTSHMTKTVTLISNNVICSIDTVVLDNPIYKHKPVSFFIVCMEIRCLDNATLYLRHIASLIVIFISVRVNLKTSLGLSIKQVFNFTQLRD